MSRLFYCTIITSIVSLSSQEVVQTAQGKLHALDQGGILSYMGIPYASVLDQNERFKRGNLAPYWSDIRESRRHHCTQASNVQDCLTLDVHTPKYLARNTPVLAWVSGTAAEYYPHQLVGHGIIVVVIKHRLGPLGFLCTKEDRVPGNAGAKDVVLALRWVRDNIIAFKGNPNRVVVAGQGLGGALAEALMLSPMATNLFHGVIVQSGTCLAPWAFNYDAELRAKGLAGLISNNKDSISTLIDANPEDLAMKSERLNFSYYPFGICAEKGFKTEELFLPAAVYDIFTDNKLNHVPVIIGYNNDEGYIFADTIQRANILNRISDKLDLLMPTELKFASEQEFFKIKEQIKKMYFDKNSSATSVLIYYRDAYFTSHIHKSTTFHSSSNQPVYYYQFAHVGNTGVQPHGDIPKTGAAHSDELAYLFPDKGKTLTDEDGVVQRKLTKLWTNFVKYLNPTPIGSEVNWEPFSAGNPRQLLIKQQMKLIDFPHSVAAKMWDELYEERYFKTQKKNNN